MTMVWEPEKECMQREELRQLQLEQLQAVLARVYMHVPFYRKQFDACKVDPDDFCSLDDLRRLPFTSKADLPGELPLRPVRRAVARRRAHPRLGVHVHRGGVHAQ